MNKRPRTITNSSMPKTCVSKKCIAANDKNSPNIDWVQCIKCSWQHIKCIDVVCGFCHNISIEENKVVIKEYEVKLNVIYVFFINS